MDKKCVFCKIVNEEAPANLVYEDDDNIAFLDINPVSLGHTLILPKRHHENLLETPLPEINLTFIAVYKIAKAITTVVGAPAFRVVINNGREAGQVVYHFHVHVIPYFEKGTGFPEGKVSKEELKSVADKIREVVK